jgi:hypothetical protein
MFKRTPEFNRKPKDGQRWGNWRLFANDRVLIHPKYEVRLNSMRDSAAALDWIAQVSMKTWSTPADIGYLVEALDDIFSLQGSFCGNATNRTIGAEAFLNNVFPKPTMCAQCSKVAAIDTRGKNFTMVCEDCAEEWDEERKRNED